MRVAVWHNLPSGGGKRALRDHVGELVRRDHEVRAWCPPTADREFLPLTEIVEETVVPLGDPEPPWLRLLVKAGLRSNLHGRLRTMEQHCRAVTDAIGDAADVVFANSSRSLRVPPIGRFGSLPTVLYLQEPLRRLFEAQPESPLVDERWVQRRGWRAVVRAQRESLEAFDLVLVNSFFSRESVLRAHGVDARVCYLGVDTARFSPPAERRDDHLVGVGNIAPGKNVEFVIEAVGRAGSPSPLVWIGNTEDPGYADELRALAARARVQLDLRVAVGDDELIDVLRRATAMVYAPRLEPFGYAPLEANACGVPVIGVAEGGLRETIVDGETGLLVPPDVEAFAGAISRVAGDVELNRRLGRTARQRVERDWTLAAAGARLEEALESVARPASPGCVS